MCVGKISYKSSITHQIPLQHVYGQNISFPLPGVVNQTVLIQYFTMSPNMLAAVQSLYFH